MNKILSFLENAKFTNYKTFSGLQEGEKSLIASMKSNFIYVCPNFVLASRLKRAFESLGKRVEIISSGRENVQENDKNLYSFISAVFKLRNKKIDGIIILPSGVTTKFDKSIFDNVFSLKLEQEISFDTIQTYLVSKGYERVDIVSLEGEYAIRGDILDIFSIGEEKPFRIEFFDDIIEKISIFDLFSMKSETFLENISISPAILKVGEDDITSICDDVIIDETKKIESEIQLLKRSQKELSFYDEKMFISFEEVVEKASLIFDNFGEFDYDNLTIGHTSYVVDFIKLLNDIKMYKNSDHAVCLFGDERSAKRLADFLSENYVNFYYLDKVEEIERGNIYICKKQFPYSFSFLNEGFIGIGADDLFKNNQSEFSKTKHNVFYLPKINDYVVHSFHGIGKCVDIVRMKLSDYEKDYFIIEYKNGGLLYLPSEQANLLSAYLGGDKEPKLNNLGSPEFTKLKQRVKEGLKELAFNLAEVYKERQNSKGYIYEKDEVLDQAFDEKFPFQVTVDQAKAIKDIEEDMHGTKIMDRLICGDVGFGKTEVAFRACFTAAYNGKQVAFLCPTTILSEQHFRNCKERMKDFMVKVEVINRFKTQRQIDDILRRLKDGKIDILIGTHRLLSSQVQFKDLGLLVLDEEQRFGVSDKEKIKNIKRNIDVLTLSATPIPRTLHMSLSGIRDISIIATPPKERLPIQTYVCEYQDQLLKDVVNREISRGGKVFIIYNRVSTIYEFSGFVSGLVPNATVGVAHGQMAERELEKVITDLYDGKFNVLISTTLIENGIDLPSANTLFVIDCDQLGLSQLYQIRGRIGRGDKLAYAYLTYTKDKILTDDAYKRLDAIKEFRELGSGFKIAMRDLEIRGAGNILGKEQHGHLEKVGYDMYVKLLDESIQELQGKKVKEQREIKIDIPLDAYISEDYITSSEERIVFYSKISEIDSFESLKDVLLSLSDAFGVVPLEVENLCKIAFLKNIASEFGVKRIKTGLNEINVYLYKCEEIINKSLSVLLSKYKARLSFEEVPVIKMELGENNRKKIDLLINLFNEARMNEEK